MGAMVSRRFDIRPKDVVIKIVVTLYGIITIPKVTAKLVALICKNVT